ncbi:MAG TPA: purine-nucleoside phosphorylase [Candidatus Limnocylindria bacterium]|nr:purine-nucleoside phosphorylase [Candidatus Limnocylindria bacterium]
MTDHRLGNLPDGIYGAELQRRIDEAAAAIRERLSGEPRLASPQLVFVLGSGLGGVVDLLDGTPRVSIPYGDIPHVPTGSVAGHAGELVAGIAHETAVIVLSGRAHPYEGYSHREATLLLRAVLTLGPRTLVLTNAAGGINPGFAAGEVMLIRDTINLSGENPLLGPNLDAFGPRFPAMTDAFDPPLRAAASRAAERAGITLHEGVYLMLSGPAYETRAELRMLRILGADAVGMSTVHEAIVARHADRRLLGFSLITNPATEDVEAGPTHEEVMEMGKVGGERLLAILRELLPDLV